MDCPWDNGSVLEWMRLYGNLPNFPRHIPVSENFSKRAFTDTALEILSTISSKLDEAM